MLKKPVILKQLILKAKITMFLLIKKWIVNIGIIFRSLLKGTVRLRHEIQHMLKKPVSWQQ